MDEFTLKGIALATLCSCLSLILHLGISFFRKGRLEGEPSIFGLIRQTKLILFIWAFTFVIYGLLFFKPIDKISLLVNGLTGRFDAIGFIYGLCFYLMLAFVYLTFYYFVDRSVSATILEIIDKAPEGKLCYSEIKEVYGVEGKYLSELNGMLQGGFIVEEAGYYRNSFKGRCYAHLAKTVKSFLKLGQGG